MLLYRIHPSNSIYKPQKIDYLCVNQKEKIYAKEITNKDNEYKTANQVWDFYVLLEVKNHFECGNSLFKTEM
jgi:hypothetical protein